MMARLVKWGSRLGWMRQVLVISLNCGIGANQCKIVHKWAQTVLNGDFDTFEDDR